MPKYAYKVLSESEAAAAILHSRPHFIPWIGAGVSVESRIPSAQKICDDLAAEFISRIQRERQLNNVDPAELTKEERQEVLNRELSWSDPSTRYSRTMKRVHAAAPFRVDFFRRLVAGRSPSFAHYATALLTERRIFSSDCLTTNFDKLLEKAYHDIGSIECQPIRSASELEYHQTYEDKAFCLKIHGDYDTHNLLNTEEETVVIEEALVDYLQLILKNRGLVVIGSAGYEKSIHTLFDRLVSKDGATKKILQYGLLWGVHIGEGIAHPEEEVRRRVEEGQISREIVKLMDRRYRDDNQFGFFPVVGAGEFLRRLILYANDADLIRCAEPYFNHAMRIRNTFQRKGLSDRAYRDHIKRLELAQSRIQSSSSPRQPMWAFKDQAVRGLATRVSTSVSLAYGSLADTRLLMEGRGDAKCAAVVSPEDTLLSIGGGTALALASAAGERTVLHDVSKLAPIPLGEVAVTSAGRLPVEYLFHGASVEIREEELIWSDESIYRTVRNALLKAVSLGVEVLFVPLLAAGTGRAPAGRSLHQILRAIFEFDFDRVPAPTTAPASLAVHVVAFQESELPRNVFAAEWEAVSRSRSKTADGLRPQEHLDARPEL
jgi:O-acetyl-ADP-ribose deacetylase